MNYYPKISIVTPSYNQAQFLEQTIQSILSQKYPNLEYIIMDGGSTDASAEIIQKYSDKLTYWQSKKDSGQADAILSGFEMCTGDVIGWINSDDVLLPGALTEVGNYFLNNSDTEFLIGSSITIDENNKVILNARGIPIFNIGRSVNSCQLMYWGCGFNQPASFWKREVYNKIGKIDKSFYFSFDLDLFIRLTLKKRSAKTSKFLAAFRVHSQSKTTLNDDIRLIENDKILRRYESTNTSEIKIKYYKNYYRYIARIRQRVFIILYFVGLLKLPQ